MKKIVTAIALLITSLAVAVPAYAANNETHQHFGQLYPDSAWSCETHGVYLDEATVQYPEQVTAIRRALDQLSSATSGWFVVVADPELADITVRFGDMASRTALGQAVHFWDAKLTFTSAVVTLRRHLLDDIQVGARLTHTVLHEVAHGVGASHTESGLMATKVGKPTTRYGVMDLVGFIFLRKACR